MAKDGRELREEAAAATAAGKHKRALAAYLELERIEPRDAQWAKRAAETYRKLGNNKHAIEAFERSCDRYAQNGFLVQAIAVCKLILQIDPQNASGLSRLARLNEQAGQGMTRAHSFAENNPALHANPSVAAIRSRHITALKLTPAEQAQADAIARQQEAARPPWSQTTTRAVGEKPMATTPPQPDGGRAWAGAPVARSKVWTRPPLLAATLAWSVLIATAFPQPPMVAAHRSLTRDALVALRGGPIGAPGETGGGSGVTVTALGGSTTAGEDGVGSAAGALTRARAEDRAGAATSSVSSSMRCRRASFLQLASAIASAARSAWMTRARRVIAIDSSTTRLG